jgi:hypothetical protein
LLFIEKPQGSGDQQLNLRHSRRVLEFHPVARADLQQPAERPVFAAIPERLERRFDLPVGEITAAGPIEFDLVVDLGCGEPRPADRILTLRTPNSS